MGFLCSSGRETPPSSGPAALWWAEGQVRYATRFWAVSGWHTTGGESSKEILTGCFAFHSNLEGIGTTFEPRTAVKWLSGRINCGNNCGCGFICTTLWSCLSAFIGVMDSWWYLHRIDMHRYWHIMTYYLAVMLVIIIQHHLSVNWYCYNETIIPDSMGSHYRHKTFTHNT